jgi:hypothetical protein
VLKETIVTRRHFESRADLERQMDAERQLRAEILAGAAWILSALAGRWG